MTFKPHARHRRWWRKITNNFGTRFTDQFGSDPSEDWASMIDRNSDAALQSAITWLKYERPSHPPNLGEFEQALPKRKPHGDANLVDLLAQYALRNFHLCRHQLMWPWSYFGRTEERLTDRNRIERVPIIRGVVIPACSCNEGGNPGYRATVRDLGLEEPPSARFRASGS